MDESLHIAVGKLEGLYQRLRLARWNNPNSYCHEDFKDCENDDCNDIQKPIYAWQWNFTQKEYGDLKSVITEFISNNGEGALKSILKRPMCSKIVQLYISEWYKREYDGRGTDALAVVGINNPLPWYERICRNLCVDEKKVYHDNEDGSGDCRWKDTIYVDGGLPLKYLLYENKGRLFTNSIRDIVEKSFYGNNTDIAKELGDLCDNNVVNQSYRARELFPDDRDASIYDFIQEFIIQENLVVDRFEYFKTEIRTIKEEVEAKRKQRRPFDFKWLFHFDDIRNTINIGFKMTGPNCLSDEFVAAHNLEGKSYISICVKCNDNKLFTAEYDERHYCRNVERQVFCNVGDVITFEIDETKEIIATYELDLSDPKLICCVDNYLNVFSLCGPNKMENSDCRVISAVGWNSNEVESESYSIGKEDYSVFKLGQRTNPFVINLDDDDQTKTFDPNIPLFWTEINQARKLDNLRLNLQTKENLYDARSGQIGGLFYIVTDNYKEYPRRVEFAELGSREWRTTTHLGRIRARAKVGNNLKESVDTIKFINVGDLEITEVVSTVDNCCFKINWTGGTISSDVAMLNETNGKWCIEKKQHNGGYVAFHLTPNQGQGKPFDIHICPRFKGFMVLDSKMAPVKNCSVIPAIELNSYRYYRIYDNETKEGSLGDIVDKSDIDKQLESAAKIALVKGKNISFYIKKFPYGIWIENQNLSVKDMVSYNGFKYKLPQYEGELHAIPVDNPFVEPITISAVEKNKYVIPDEMKNGGYDQWLIYGNLQGLIWPKRWGRNNTNPRQQESEIRKKIKESLSNACLFSSEWQSAIKWYEMIHEGCIPAKSMQTMNAIADSPDLLIKLALHIYITNFNRMMYDNSAYDGVMENLLEFQRQMGFLWSWVHCNIDLNEFLCSNTIVDADSLKHYYQIWESENCQGNHIPMENQSEENIKKCKLQLVNDFKDWFRRLKDKSNPSVIYSSPTKPWPDLGQEAKDFFSTIIVDDNVWGDRKFICQRKKAHEILSEKNIWEIIQDYDVRKEICRSIIYGLKFKL